MYVDPRGLPTRRDDVGIVDEEIGTRMPVFGEVRHDAEMDLDVIRLGKPVATALVRPRREPQPCVVSQRHIEITDREDRRDPLQSAHMTVTLRHLGREPVRSRPMSRSPACTMVPRFRRCTIHLRMTGGTSWPRILASSSTSAMRPLPNRARATPNRCWISGRAAATYR